MTDYLKNNEPVIWKDNFGRRQNRRSWTRIEDAVKHVDQLHASGRIPILGRDEFGETFMSAIQSVIDDRHNQPVDQDASNSITRSAVWLQAVFQVPTQVATDMAPAYSASADSIEHDEGEWQKQFGLSTDAWVMEAWVCHDEEEIRLIPGSGIGADTLLGIKMVGPNSTDQISQFELVRQDADDQAREYIVVDGLSVERLWLTREALLNADESKRGELVPILLLKA